MTQAFLEPTYITKENVDLFLKTISPEAIEKVKRIDKTLRKEIQKEIEEMEKYINE